MGPLDQLGLFLGGNTKFHAPGPILLYDLPPVRGDSTGMSPISFIGLVPGMVGVYQMNFTLPGNTPSGVIAVELVEDVCGSPRTIPDCYPEFYDHCESTATPSSFRFAENRGRCP